MVHQCGPTQQEALFARRTELSVVLDQSDRRTFLVLATGSFSRNGNQMGSRRTRTIGRDSSLAPRRRKPTHLAGERVERLPDLGNTSLRSAPASSAQRCASPSTCSARPATTKPQAVACVPSWLRRTRAPPGSTPTNATSLGPASLAHRPALRPQRRRPRSRSRSPLRPRLLRHLARPFPQGRIRRSRPALVRTQAADVRACVREQPARTPNKLGGSHGQRMANSAREQTETPGNRPRQSKS